YASINPRTGSTTIYAPRTGRYIIAFNVREYRKGKLINVTRRDLQIIVSYCPPHKGPVPYNTTFTQNTFTVMAGDNLSFNTYFQDDSIMTLTALGDIFDPNSTIYPKAIISPTTGRDHLISTFYWTPACDMARSQPYTFI